MKKWLMAVIFASVLALAACGGDDGGTDEPVEPDTPDTEEPAEEETDDGIEEEDEAAEEDEGESTVDAGEAEEIYKQSCASCHAADLSGGAGPDLTTAGDDFTVEEIEDIINEGVGTMPAGLVPEDEATVLAEWLVEMD